MDDYLKSILVKFQPDETSLKAAMQKVQSIDLFSDDDLSKFETTVKNALSFDNAYKNLESALRLLQQAGDEASAKQVQKQIDALRKEDGRAKKEDRDRRRKERKELAEWSAEAIEVFGRELSSHNSELAKTLGKGAELFGGALKFGTEFFSGIITGDFDDFKDALQDIATSLIQGLANVIGSALDEMGTVLKANRLSNADTRELAFRYGFNAAEVYAWQKASDALGFRSEEDMLYATDSQRQLFTKTFTTFAEKYTALYDSGTFDTLEEFEVEMKAMKEEFTLDVAAWFVENKDALKALMTAVLDLTKAILGWLGGMIKHSQGDFSTRRHMSSVQFDYERGSSLVNNNSNVNVRIDNSFTNVQKEDQSWLANAGQLTYQQVIRALGGTS